MQNSLVSSSTFLYLVSPSKQYQYDNNKSENKKKKERIVKGRKVGRVSDKKTGPQLNTKPVSFLPIYYLGRTYPSFQKNAHCRYLASPVSSSLVKTLSPPFQHPAAVAETIWLSLTPYIIQCLLFEVAMCPSRQPPLQLDNKPRVYLVKPREPEAEMIALCSQVEQVDFLKST